MSWPSPPTLARNPFFQSDRPEPPPNKTQSPVHQTQPPVHPTKPPIHPTQPAVHPNQPPVHPNQPTVHPNQPAVHPSLIKAFAQPHDNASYGTAHQQANISFNVLSLFTWGGQQGHYSENAAMGLTRLTDFIDIMFKHDRFCMESNNLTLFRIAKTVGMKADGIGKLTYIDNVNKPTYTVVPSNTNRIS